jgi:outer membrane protein
VYAGKFPKGELLKQKALVVQDEVSVVEAQNALDLAYLNLYNLLDINNGKVFKVHEPINIVVDANKSLMTAKYYYEKAVTKRPEVEAAKLRLKSSEKNLEIAKGDKYPTLSMGAGWSTYFADNIKDLVSKETITFSDQLKNHERKYFGFRLDIPIFNGWHVSSSIKNSKYEIESARLDLQKTKNILRQEIQQAYSKAMSAMKRYYANNVAVESNEEAFRYSQEKYNLGMIDIVSYNQSKKEYITAKSKFLQAKYDYIFRTKILNFYCGIPITLK